MRETCKICSEDFADSPLMLEHFLEEHLSKLKDIGCLFCEKNFENFDDLMHHIELDHTGMTKSLLQNGTLARETKKQLGDYISENEKMVGMECPECFEIFTNIDKLSEHAKKEHKREILPNFLEKIKKRMQNANQESPLCEKCNKCYIGVIFTKINNKVMNICFNCYEDYFGANALARVTIGTNDDMIKKMRIPIQ